MFWFVCTKQQQVHLFATNGVSLTNTTRGCWQVFQLRFGIFRPKSCPLQTLFCQLERNDGGGGVRGFRRPEMEEIRKEPEEIKEENNDKLCTVITPGRMINSKGNTEVLISP